MSIDDAIERYLDTLEAQQAGKVFCGECTWFAPGYEGKPCYHPHAEVEVVTPVAWKLGHQSALDRNRHHDCPDFEAGPNVHARAVQAYKEREEAEAAEYRARVLAWWVRRFPRLNLWCPSLIRRLAQWSAWP